MLQYCSFCHTNSDGWTNCTGRSNHTPSTLDSLIAQYTIMSQAYMALLGVDGADTAPPFLWRLLKEWTRLNCDKHPNHFIVRPISSISDELAQIPPSSSYYPCRGPGNHLDLKWNGYVINNRPRGPAPKAVGISFLPTRELALAFFRGDVDCSRGIQLLHVTNRE